MLGRRPRGQIGPACGDELERERRSEPVEARQVHADDAVPCSAYVAGERVLLAALPARRRPWRGRRLGGAQRYERGGDASVAGGDLLLVGIVARDRLRSGERMLGPLVARQGPGDVRGRALAPAIAKARQYVRIARPGEDRADDAPAGLAGDGGDAGLLWQIHRRQRLLQVLDVGGRIVHKALALA